MENEGRNEVIKRITEGDIKSNPYQSKTSSGE
jgi:hypothetical protein